MKAREEFLKDLLLGGFALVAWRAKASRLARANPGQYWKPVEPGSSSFRSGFDEQASPSRIAGCGVPGGRCRARSAALPKLAVTHRAGRFRQAFHHLALPISQDWMPGR